MTEKTRKHVLLFFGGVFFLLFCYATIDLPHGATIAGPMAT